MWPDQYVRPSVFRFRFQKGQRSNLQQPFCLLFPHIMITYLTRILFLVNNYVSCKVWDWLEYPLARGQSMWPWRPWLWRTPTRQRSNHDNALKMIVDSPEKNAFTKWTRVCDLALSLWPWPCLSRSPAEQWTVQGHSLNINENTTRETRDILVVLGRDRDPFQAMTLNWLLTFRWPWQSRSRSQPLPTYQSSFQSINYFLRNTLKNV